MAQANAAQALQMQIHRIIGFVSFMISYMKKKNPIKKTLSQSIAYVKELASMKRKLKKIKNMIQYEQYKYKKTEMILAQNREHFFLNGRTINQTR